MDELFTIENNNYIIESNEEDNKKIDMEEEELNQNESTQKPSESSINDHQFSMSVSDYQLGAVVGFGSSAIVYMAKYLPLSMDVAVKMIELDHFERNRIDELRKEIQVMAFCKHPNLLSNLTSFVHESKLWIVTPFLAGGSCLDIMKSGFKDGFDESVIATILVQALQGLEYLHENGHIHRDVKSGNLLMAEDGLVQLGDFGVSSSLIEDGERHGIRKTYVGTPCWMAPEVMEITRGYDFKADIWSFGITALELAYGHAPYAKFPPMKVIYLTISGKPPTLDKKQSPRKYSRMMKDMIDCCLQRDPAKRPTAKALLKHPFFKTMTKKPQFLVASVLNKVAPVNLRDKSAQLRARGLPVPSSQDEAGADGNETTDYASRSYLTQVLTAEDEDNEDTSESWDFSIDNSVEPDVTPSAFDAIVEEEEEEEEELDDSNIKTLPSKVREFIENTSDPDPLPDARPLTDGEANFHGLQKNRTSRFILAADEDIKEAMGRLDLSSTVISSDQESHDIVGSVNESDLSQSNNVTSPISSSSSSEGQFQMSSSFNTRSSSPNDANDSVPTEVKKGRFSVLEAVNTTDVDPTDENDILESGGIMAANQNNGSPTANNVNSFNYHEEEKRSRFEVSLNVPAAEISDSEDPDGAKNESNSTSFEPTQQVFSSNIYHNSAPMISGPTYSSYPIGHPAPQYIPAGTSFYSPPSLATMYAPPLSSFHHHHRPSVSSVPFYPLHSPHPTATSVPLSPVNPAQLDHLLHVNDYIRNQLVELKYRQEILQFHQHHQLPPQPQPQPPQQVSQPGMRPHSTFNPHNYPNTNNEIYHQLHHSHPVMPPANNSSNEPMIPSYSIDLFNQSNCFCCPNNSSSNYQSISNSVSPIPADSTSTAAANAAVSSANLNFILKELETIKKENEILKSYFHQQQQQQKPQ